MIPDKDTDSRLDNDLVEQSFRGADKFHEETGQSGIMLERPPSLEDLEWLSGLASLSGPQ